MAEEQIPELSDDDLFELGREARVELARRYAKEKNILGWGKVLFPDKFYLPFCHEMHRYFIDVRGDPLTNTEAPRNHAKTTIRCFLIPLFQALEEPECFRHYLNVQATDEKALAINRAIREELENNEELREIYGDQVGKRWTDQQFVLKNGVIFTARSAGQSIRGINYNNIRPDYIIVDDLYNDDDINNPDATEKKNAWFWGSLYPARAKSRRCALHIQGTAINNYDLLERLKKQARWKSRTFCAIKSWDTKEVLWAELNTFESLMEDKADMGSVIFMREMQNERREESAAIIKHSWLYPPGQASWEYDPGELKFDHHHFISAVLLLCDPSIGEKEQNDFVGTALILKTTFDDGRGNQFFIEALWEEKLSLDKRVKLLQDIADGRPKQHPISEVRIEAIAGFKDFAAEVIRRTNLPVQIIDHVKDKISNLENKSHYFENQKVKLNKHIDPKLKDTIVYQLTTNYPKHDDVRDAVLLSLDDKTGSWGFVS